MNNETVTKAICNKGFSGNSSILPRIKFRVGGQDSSSQSLTAHSLSRYRSVEEKKKHTLFLEIFSFTEKLNNQKMLQD
jgi:hypothetical protein